MVRMPNTIGDNLQRLITAKTDIKNAIIQMGGGSDDSHGLEDFADDILTIPSGGQTEWDMYLTEGTTNITATAGDNCGSITIGSDSISSLTLSKTTYGSIAFEVHAKVNDLFGITGIHTLNSSFFNYINSISSDSKPHIEYSCDVYVPAGIIKVRGGGGGGYQDVSFSIKIFGTTIYSAVSSYSYDTRSNSLIDQHFSYTDIDCTKPAISISTYIGDARVDGSVVISSGFQISNIVAKICL
jgi:hypothetical protein